MRQGQAFGPQLQVPEQQQIEIDRPGPLTRATEDTPVLDLDGLGDIEELLGAERSPDAGDGVEEVGLVEDLSDRLCLVEGGDRLDLDVVGAELGNRPADVRLAIPEVRAEPDVADPLGSRGLAQIPCSSPGSRSIDPSRVTSTPASSTV